MIIAGKERKFALTVGAYEDIEKLCPNAEIGRLGDLLSGQNLMSNLINLAVILNRAYEEVNTPEGEKVESLTRKEVRKVSSINELMDEVSKAIDDGQETTVDTEPVIKKNEVAEEN